MVHLLTTASSAQKVKALMTKAAQSTLIDVLLVEDSESDAELMSDALQEGDLLKPRIKWVVDGEAALEYLQGDAKRPDLILLDLRLPKMSGHEVLRHIKMDSSLRRIPVVILTAHKEGIPDAYNDHANCCVTKPSDLEEFALAVKKIESFWITIASRARGS